jgi:hypothetical protein
MGLRASLNVFIRENILPLRAFEPRTVQPVALSLHRRTVKLRTDPAAILVYFLWEAFEIIANIYIRYNILVLYFELATRKSRTVRIYALANIPLLSFTLSLT